MALALILPLAVNATSALPKRRYEVAAYMKKRPSREEIEEIAVDWDGDLRTKVPVYIENELLFKTNRQFDLGLDACYDEGLNMNPHSLIDVLVSYPTDAIRRKGEDSIYLVYDTDSGYRLYLYSQGKNYMSTTSGHPVIIGYPHIYDDYRGLNVGDSIKAVEKIDSVANLVEKEIHDVWHLDPIGAAGMAEDGFPFATVHYLRDGILRIEYEMLEDRSLVISNMEYRDDYRLEQLNGNVIDYRINDKDLPQSWRKNK